MAVNLTIRGQASGQVIYSETVVVLVAGHHSGHLDMGTLSFLGVQHSPALYVLWGSQVVKGPQVISLCVRYLFISHSHQCLGQVCIIWGLCWSPDIILCSYHLPGPAAALLGGQVLLVTTETLWTKMVILCHLKHILILLAIMWMYFKFILFLPEKKLNDAKKGEGRV